MVISHSYETNYRRVMAFVSHETWGKNIESYLPIVFFSPSAFLVASAMETLFQNSSRCSKSPGKIDHSPGLCDINDFSHWRRNRRSICGIWIQWIQQPLSSGNGPCDLMLFEVLGLLVTSHGAPRAFSCRSWVGIRLLNLWNLQTNESPSVMVFGHISGVSWCIYSSLEHESAHM